MWWRKLRRAFEVSGARAPGAAVGWTVVVILMLLIPAGRLGLYPVGDPPEQKVEGTLPGDESALGPTVTSSPDAATTDSELESTLTTMEPEQGLIAPTVPGETPTTQAISTTRPETAAGPTSTTVSTATTEATTETPATGAPTTPTPTTLTSTTATPTTSVPTPTTLTSTTTTPTTGAPTPPTPTTTTSSTVVPTTTTPTTTTPTTATSTTQAPDPNFAVGDVYQLESGAKANLRVLDNDGNQGFLDPGTLEIIAPSSHAESLVRGNHIRYESDENYTGPDSLRYRICTIDGVCAVATVTIQVIDG